MRGLRPVVTYGQPVTGDGNAMSTNNEVRTEQEDGKIRDTPRSRRMTRRAKLLLETRTNEYRDQAATKNASDNPRCEGHQIRPSKGLKSPITRADLARRRKELKRKSKKGTEATPAQIGSSLQVSQANPIALEKGIPIKKRRRRAVKLEIGGEFAERGITEQNKEPTQVVDQQSSIEIYTQGGPVSSAGPVQTFGRSKTRVKENEGETKRNFGPSVQPKRRGYSKRNFWTNEEDALLLSAVQEHGENNWAKIAEYLPDRMHNSIMTRWMYEVNPALSKAPYSKEEDMNLFRAMRDGKKSSELREIFPNRAEVKLRNRCRTAIFPILKKTGKNLSTISESLMMEAIEEAHSVQHSNMLPNSSEDC